MATLSEIRVRAWAWSAVTLSALAALDGAVSGWDKILALVVRSQGDGSAATVVFALGSTSAVGMVCAAGSLAWALARRARWTLAAMRVNCSLSLAYTLCSVAGTVLLTVNEPGGLEGWFVVVGLFLGAWSTRLAAATIAVVGLIRYRSATFGSKRGRREAATVGARVADTVSDRNPASPVECDQWASELGWVCVILFGFGGAYDTVWALLHLREGLAPWSSQGGASAFVHAALSSAGAVTLCVAGVGLAWALAKRRAAYRWFLLAGVSGGVGWLVGFAVIVVPSFVDDPAATRLVRLLDMTGIQVAGVAVGVAALVWSNQARRRPGRESGDVPNADGSAR